MVGCYTGTLAWDYSAELQELQLSCDLCPTQVSSCEQSVLSTFQSRAESEPESESPNGPINCFLVIQAGPGSVTSTEREEPRSYIPQVPLGTLSSPFTTMFDNNLFFSCQFITKLRDQTMSQFYIIMKYFNLQKNIPDVKKITSDKNQ